MKTWRDVVLSALNEQAVTRAKILSFSIESDAFWMRLVDYNRQNLTLLQENGIVEGGEDSYTWALLNLCLSIYSKDLYRPNVSLNSEAHAKLFDTCHRLKFEIENKKESTIILQTGLNIQITSEIFKQSIMPIIEATETHVQDWMKEFNIKIAELDFVLFENSLTCIPSLFTKLTTNVPLHKIVLVNEKKEETKKGKEDTCVFCSMNGTNAISMTNIETLKTEIQTFYANGTNELKEDGVQACSTCSSNIVTFNSLKTREKACEERLIWLKIEAQKHKLQLLKKIENSGSNSPFLIRDKGKGKKRKRDETCFLCSQAWTERDKKGRYDLSTSIPALKTHAQSMLWDSIRDLFLESRNKSLPLLLPLNPRGEEESICGHCLTRLKSAWTLLKDETRDENREEEKGEVKSGSESFVILEKFLPDGTLYVSYDDGGKIKGEIEKEIKIALRETQRLMSNIHNGDHVLTLDNKTEWERGIIQNISDSNIKIYLIDIGLSVEVRVESIRQSSQSLKKIPPRGRLIKLFKSSTQTNFEPENLKDYIGQRFKLELIGNENEKVSPAIISLVK